MNLVDLPIWDDLSLSVFRGRNTPGSTVTSLLTRPRVWEVVPHAPSLIYSDPRTPVPDPWWHSHVW